MRLCADFTGRCTGLHAWINAHVSTRFARCPVQVREYDGVVGRLQATIKPLLRPHLEDMEKKIAPGFSLLTWTSMNIDGYLHRFKQVGLQHGSLCVLGCCGWRCAAVVIA